MYISFSKKMGLMIPMVKKVELIAIISIKTFYFEKCHCALRDICLRSNLKNEHELKKRHIGKDIRQK